MYYLDRNSLFWLQVAAYSTIKPAIVKDLLSKFTIAEIYDILQSNPASIGIKKGQSNQKLVDDACTWLAKSTNHHLLTFDNKHYPCLLKHIYDPPLVLFAVGDIAALVNNGLSIVGSRRCSQYGLKVAHNLGSTLAVSGLNVISGMALGIDSAAHKGALTSFVGKTVAVLGSGLNNIYPQSNKKLFADIAAKGCVLSELFPDTPPFPYNFPKRNRIISGLSLAVVVVEAAARSGTLVTARLALEQGREVFAIPGSIFSPNSAGCHHLLRQGAVLAHSVDDIFMELDLLRTKATDKYECSNEEQILLDHIKGDSVSIDVLQALTKMSLDQLTKNLFSLELAGLIVADGGCYMRCK